MTTTDSADISDDVVACIGELSVGAIGRGAVRIVADERASLGSAQYDQMQNTPKRATIASGPASLLDNIPTGPALPELFTVSEAAALLRISASGVRRLQQQRHLSFIKVGGSVRFAKSDLSAYLTRQRVGPVDQ